MLVGISKETVPGERRVALVPELIPLLTRKGMTVQLQREAGSLAGYPDAVYRDAGADIVESVWEQSNVILKVQPPTMSEILQINRGANLIGFLRPEANREGIEKLAERGITAFAMERMPRIARAQPMDALSAMSTVAGYKAVLLAADRLPKFFPLLMTAAGTIKPARVFVVGAGVAGLQAIGTARRLGAAVEAYDPRPAVKEQIESLGARFADLGLEARDAESGSGYAKAQSESFYRQQREQMARHVAAADVVITSALVPGQRAPVLITAEMVRGMRPGSVIVDLAAEQGGNCELTEPGQQVEWHGVCVVGLLNLPSLVACHASQMYAHTVTHYLLHLCQQGDINPEMDDELTRAPLVSHQGKVLISW